MDYLHRTVHLSFIVANVILFISLLFLKTEDFFCVEKNVLVDSLEPKIGDNSNILLNMTNFEYLLNNETVCGPKEKNQLLVIVPSAIENSVGRESIRKTWGIVQSYKNWRIRTIFLVGMRASGENWDLTVESGRYGDLVQGNFVDSYKALTFKHCMAFKWTSEWCPQADYILKVDDDVFVDLLTVVDMLQVHQGTDLICPILNDRRVERNKTNKWHVTWEEFSPESYPPYCLGAGYLLSTKWINRIYSAASRLGFFWIDDIFMTGIAREAAQVEANQKMSLLSLELFTHVLIDVDPDVVIRNYLSLANSSHSAQFPALYATIKRKQTFEMAMHYLWQHVLTIKSSNLK